MKKIVIAFGIALLPALFAAEDMPPMPMSPPADAVKPNKVVPKPPQECDAVPPMLIYLPPELEKDMAVCKNLLYKPSMEAAQKALEKIFAQKVQIKDISMVPKYKELYRIVAIVDKKERALYCNSDVDACLELAAVDMKKITKGKK